MSVVKCGVMTFAPHLLPSELYELISPYPSLVVIMEDMGLKKGLL